MSPAAVDFRSQVTSSQPQPSSISNPNPKYHAPSFTSFDFGSFSSNNLSEPTVDNASVDNAGGTSFSSPFVSRTAPVKPPVSAGTGRSKPRLVKLRKHAGFQHGRSGTSSTEIDSGFNPFRSVENSGGVKEDTSTSRSTSNVKFENVGFAFGAKRSDSKTNLDLGTGDFSKSMEKSGFCLFGSNQGDLDLSLESGRSQFFKSVDTPGSYESGIMKNGSDPKNVNFDNLGFAFGADRNNSTASLSGEKKESTGNAGKSGDTHNVKFVFGANQSDSVANLNSDNTMGNLGFDGGKIMTEAKYGKHEKVGFVFAANQINLASNSNMEKNADNCKMKNGVGAKIEKNDDEGFVFGASRSNLASNLKCKKKESVVSGAGSISDDGGKVKVETETRLQNMKAAGLNLNLTEVGSSILDDNFSSLDKAETNKLNSESSKSCSNFGKTQSGNLFDVGNEKCDFAFRSSDNVTTPFGTGSVFELPDEMNRLNINDNSTNESKDSNDADNFFVFRSGTKASCSSAGGCTSNIASGSNGISSTKPYASQAGLGESPNVGEFQGQANDDTNPNGAATPSPFSSGGLGFQPSNGVSEAPSLGSGEQKDGCSSTTTPDVLGASFTDFKTPKWDPSCFRADLFPRLNKSLDFRAKRRSIDSRPKKTRGKLKQHTLAKHGPGKDPLPKESSLQINLDSPGSPMDFSPYQETVVADQLTRETFGISSESSSHIESNSAPHATASSVEKNEHIAAVGDGFSSDKGGRIFSKPNEDGSWYHSAKDFVTDSHLEEFVSEAETAHPSSINEQVCSNNGAGVTAADAGAGFTYNTEKQFCFSGLEDICEGNFTFSATPSGQGNLSATKRQYRKYRGMKVGGNPLNINPSSNVNVASASVNSSFASTSLHLGTIQRQKGDSSHFQTNGESKSKEDGQVKEESFSASSAARECEKWRIRGNQAYEKEDLSKAEGFYTWGINSVPSTETSDCCMKPLVLCYSNRAATRMLSGRVREALGDCMMATTLDSNFLKVQMRAAKCHLLLGEVEDARQYFTKCLESGSDVCLDRTFTIQASDGLQKSQKVAEWMNQCAELLQKRTSDAAANALGLIDEALSISMYSEKLLEMKAEALCMLRKYEEVVQLCEQTLDFAEKNFAMLRACNQLASLNGHECKKYSYVRLWRLRLISKSYFHLGSLKVALDLLEKQEQGGSITDKCKSRNVELSLSLAATIRELLHHKNAGNESFLSGKHAEALEHYTAALSSNVESRPFAAICFCNRAAAHQALGQIADAIADCSLAIALDGNYPKAVSRRATLYEMIRDYGQAASDLQRVISISEKRSHEKTKRSGGSDGPRGSTKELRQACRRLSSMEELAKKEIPLDLYLILGIKPSDTAGEVKKAYRKAALRHHPDKAGQFLARSESGDDGCFWKEIAEEVHKDADMLFKMIGEAYAVLSDPAKRLKYDEEEEMRKAIKECNDRRESDIYGYAYEYGRSANRRNSRETWRTYGNSYSNSRWHNF